MPAPKLSCIEIVEEILKGGIFRKEAMTQLFHKFYGFVPTIAKETNVSLEEVQDCYSDVITDFEKKVLAEKFIPQAEGSCSSYIYRSLKNKAISVYRKRQNEAIKIPLEEAAPPSDEMKDSFEIEDIRNILNGMDPTCQKVLLLWAEGYTMKEIAQEVGLSDGNSAAVTKFNCLKKLREAYENLLGE